MYEDKLKSDYRRPNYLWLILILIVFLLTLGVLVYYIRFRTSISPKASSFNSASVVSISNSYVFASPVRAKANGDLIRITVFILDDEGNGILDRRIELRSLGDKLNIKAVQSLTDETGKAIFDIQSTIAGVFNLEVFTDDLVLPQKVKVVFD